MVRMKLELFITSYFHRVIRKGSNGYLRKVDEKKI